MTGALRADATNGVGEGANADGASVFVANLQWWTTDAELERLCSEYGEIVGMRFIEDKSCGKSRGMAVVEFSQPHAAQACIDGMNGKEINGRACRVNKQIPRGGGPMGQMGPMGRGGGGRGRGGPPLDQGGGPGMMMMAPQPMIPPGAVPGGYMMPFRPPPPPGPLR